MPVARTAVVRDTLVMISSCAVRAIGAKSGSGQGLRIRSRVMLIYGATMFLSAFLLFLVQPMIGKFILPWFGGAPAVWTTCMLFFQALLLVGYAYAHGIATKLPLKRQ